MKQNSIMDMFLRATGVHGRDDSSHPSKEAAMASLLEALLVKEGGKVSENGEIRFSEKRDVFQYSPDGSRHPIKDAHVETVVFSSIPGIIDWPTEGLDENYGGPLAKAKGILFLTTVKDTKGKIVSEHATAKDGTTYLRRFKDGKPISIDVTDESNYQRIDLGSEEGIYTVYPEVYRYHLTDDGKTVSRRDIIRPNGGVFIDLKDGKRAKVTSMEYALNNMSYGKPIYKKEDEFLPDGSEVIKAVSARPDHMYPDVSTETTVRPDGERTEVTEQAGQKTVVTKKDRKKTIKQLDYFDRPILSDVARAKRKDAKSRNEAAEAIKAARKKEKTLLQRLGLTKTGRAEALEIAEKFHSTRRGLSGITPLKDYLEKKSSR